MAIRIADNNSMISATQVAGCTSPTIREIQKDQTTFKPPLSSHFNLPPKASKSSGSINPAGIFSRLDEDEDRANGDIKSAAESATSGLLVGEGNAFKSIELPPELDIPDLELFKTEGG